MIPDIYPAEGRKVRILVANNGSEGKLLQAGQKLEGLVVSEIRGTIQPPTPKPRAAATESEPRKEEPPKVSEMKEPPRQDFSKLLEDLEIPENKLLQDHPKI